jgi:hypothetical protein
MYFIIVAEIIRNYRTYLWCRDFFDCNVKIPNYAIIEMIELEDHYKKFVLCSAFIKDLKKSSENPKSRYQLEALYMVGNLLNKSLEELKEIEKQQPQPPENTGLY